jgi:hypothetical protein
MSTQEKFKQCAVCHCGAGYIERDFYLPDNPYSTAYVSDPVINCTLCASNWRVLSENVLVEATEDKRTQGTPSRFRPIWTIC